MDNTQSVHPANPTSALLNSSAKVAFSDFLKQVTKSDSKGFINEVNDQKVFSFETYLRETGRPEDSIHIYCNYIKSIEDTSERATLYKLTDYRVWIRSLLFTMVPGVVLYLLVTAFLWTFDIPFLNWVPFIFFALSCPFLFVLLFFSQYLRMKKEERSEEPLPQYIIKYFDNDELTFVKAKSRLFVDK